MAVRASLKGDPVSYRELASLATTVRLGRAPRAASFGFSAAPRPVYSAAVFEAVLHPNRDTAGRWSRSALVAFGIHAGLLLAAIGIGAGSAKVVKKAVDVTFVHAAPAAAAAAPPPPLHTKVHKVLHKLAQLPKDIIVPPKQAPEKPPEKEEDDDDGVEGGVEGGLKGGIVGGILDGGVVGGILGGVVGGVVGGVKGGVLGGTLDFDSRMVRPKKISGPDPQYTQQALEHDVQGLMSIKCIIKTDGTVHGCKILKGLPYMGDSVTGALEKRVYTPVMLGGRPIEVYYTFNLRLQMPQE